VLQSAAYKSSRDENGRCEQVRAATQGECSKTGATIFVKSARSMPFNSASFGIAYSD
jgi:hypothetical protein